MGTGASHELCSWGSDYTNVLNHTDWLNDVLEEIKSLTHVSQMDPRPLGLAGRAPVVEVISQSVAAITSYSKGRELSQCTGTLVEHDTVVTAGNCLEDSEKRLKADQVIVRFGEHQYISRRFQQHPGYGKHTHTDVAIVVLDQSAPEGYTPVQLMKEHDLEMNQLIGVAGFGLSPALDPHTKLLRGAVHEVGIYQGDIIESVRKGGVCLAGIGGPIFYQTKEITYLAGVVARPGTLESGNCWGTENPSLVKHGLWISDARKELLSR